MDDRRIPEYTLDLFADRTNARDVARGILHLIFFHRTFSTITPSTLDVLDLTLPRVLDNDLDTLLSQRITDLLRSLDIDQPHQVGGYISSFPSSAAITTNSASAPTSSSSSGRGHFTIAFSEKRRRKGWFGSAADEELVWERWVISLTLANPKTEEERRKVRSAMEKSVDNAFGKIMGVVGRETAHIPPITTNEGNPFPFSVKVGRRDEGWGNRMRVF